MSEWAGNTGKQNVNYELWETPMLANSRQGYTCSDIGALCLEACRARSLHHSRVVSPPRLHEPNYQPGLMYTAKGSRGLTYLPEFQMIIQRYTVKVRLHFVALEHVVLITIF